MKIMDHTKTSFIMGVSLIFRWNLIIMSHKIMAEILLSANIIKLNMITSSQKCPLVSVIRLW